MEYLPDLNWKNYTVVDTILEDTYWWLDRFDLDGLRLDAVAMMPRLATRHLRYKIQNNIHGFRPYLIGETYTGNDGRAKTGQTLGPQRLSGPLHFPRDRPTRSVLPAAHP